MNGTYRRCVSEAMSSPLETRPSRNCVKASMPIASAAITYQGGANALPVTSVSNFKIGLRRAAEQGHTGRIGHGEDARPYGRR